MSKPVGIRFDDAQVEHLKRASDLSGEKVGSLVKAGLALPLEVEAIEVDGPRRKVDDVTVDALVASIQGIGLLNPITVRIAPDGPHLVAGLHRLEAVRRLGWPTVPAFVVSDDLARFAEVQENLIRSELTEAQRRAQMAEYQEYLKGRGIGTSAFVARMAEASGRSETSVYRDLQIAKNVDPEVQAEAEASGVGTRTLAKAAQTDDVERQREIVEEERTRKALAKAGKKVDDDVDGDSWGTSKKILEAVVDTFGGNPIDLDPASNDDAQRRVKAITHYTIDDDGLSKEWNGRVYLNPPYSQPAAFVSKLVAEVDAMRTDEAVILVNASTSTKWFHHLLQNAYGMCIFAGRLAFHHPTTGKLTKNNRYDQVAFYFGDRTGYLTFEASFQEMGYCVEL